MQAVHSGFSSPREARDGADGLQRMMLVSFGVHIGVVAALFVLPHDWFVREKPLQIPMTLSMGTPGEKTGGQTPIGGRAIQEVAPPPPRPTPQQVATPPKTSAIAVPDKPVTKPQNRPTDPQPTQLPDRPPVTGAKVTPGSSVAATGATGQSTGLSVGGGAGGATAVLAADFCCKAYAEEVLRRIKVNWQPHLQQETGETIIVFEIRRDGTFTKPVVEKSSGSVMLDLASQAPFSNLRLLPLPEEYTGATLKIHLVFPYKR